MMTSEGLETGGRPGGDVTVRDGQTGSSRLDKKGSFVKFVISESQGGVE